MDDLISREAAIEAIKGMRMDASTPQMIWDSDAQYEIAHIPAVDAVPVVRCRDCKEWEPCNEGECGTCYLIGGLWEPHEYCSEGERRDEDAAG